MSSVSHAVGQPSRPLVALVRFLDVLDEQRLAAWRGRYGRKYPFRETTRVLIRRIILGHVEGRPLTMADAKRDLADIASPATIATEVRHLSSAGLVAEHQDRIGSHVRTTLLPTKTLLDWLEGEVRGRFRRVIASMEDWVALSEGLERHVPARAAEDLRQAYEKTALPAKLAGGSH